MKLTLFAAVFLAAVCAGCCAPCGPPRYGHRPPAGRAYVHHTRPHQALFTEWQHPLIDHNGQRRLMGDAAFRDWQCQPAVKIQPLPKTP